MAAASACSEHEHGGPGLPAGRAPAASMDADAAARRFHARPEVGRDRGIGAVGSGFRRRSFSLLLVRRLFPSRDPDFVKRVDCRWVCDDPFVRRPGLHRAARCPVSRPGSGRPAAGGRKDRRWPRRPPEADRRRRARASPVRAPRSSPRFRLRPSSSPVAPVALGEASDVRTELPDFTAQGGVEENRDQDVDTSQWNEEQHLHDLKSPSRESPFPNSRAINGCDRRIPSGAAADGVRARSPPPRPFGR